jgi:hypothetical protein
MSSFELSDVVRLSDVQLMDSGLIEGEDKKVELLFSGVRVQQTDAIIISSEDVISLSKLLGKKIFIKFKIDSLFWEKCLSFGIQRGSKSSWDVSPQVWSTFDKTKSVSSTGIWYRPITLVSLDSRIINYQIIKPAPRKENKVDAFEYFSPRNSSAVFDWQSNLNGLQQQIDQELGEISQ